MAGRNHRRADGTIRPAYARHQHRRRVAKALAYDERPDRAAWVAQFKPGDREHFFTYSRFWLGRYLGQTARELDLPEHVVSLALELHANDRRWLKLRKADGTVVGIAPPLRYEKRKKKPLRHASGEPVDAVTERTDDLIVRLDP